MKLGMRNEELGIRDPVRYLSVIEQAEISNKVFPFLIPNSSFLIPLQWFADDEDAPGKTEEPTDRKIDRLREEGQVVKSQDIVSALGLLLPALLLLFFAPYMLRTCVEMVRFFLLRAIEIDPTKDAIVVSVFFRYFVRLVWPILTVAFISALFSNIAQIGLLFTTKPITPDLSRVVPRIGQYFRRIFSIDGFYKLLISFVKMLIIGAVAYVLIRSDINKLLNLQKADIWTGLTIVASLAIRMILIAAFFLLILAIPDFFFQRWRFRERNKMTRYEVKEEYKMYEADPQIQARIRGRFRELLRQNLMVEVPKADVVITNPTHYAVALRYDQRTMRDGPMVVALGEDNLAARIRKIAQDHGVPLVENKPLAQALYRETEVGDIIPEKYVNAVAVIYSQVWRLNEDRRARMSA